MPVFWRKPELKEPLLLVLLTACGAGLLFWSRWVSAAMTQAVGLCMQVLLPSLFPFFVLSSLLTSAQTEKRPSPLADRVMGRLFGLPGSCAAAVVLGAVGGYPVGARVVANLYHQGRCGKEDALRALRFCNNAGPAFLISAVGAGLLGDLRLGGILYGFHLLSALIIGVLFAGKRRSVKQFDFPSTQRQKQRFSSCFLQAVKDSFSSFLNVCAFVLLFAVIMSLLRQLSFLSRMGALWQGLLFGALELTSGTAQLVGAALPHRMLLPAMSFLCGWGGLSVQLQAISFLQEAQLPCGDYVRFKLLHGVLAAVLTAILFR